MENEIQADLVEEVVGRGGGNVVGDGVAETWPLIPTSKKYILADKQSSTVTMAL